MLEVIGMKKKKLLMITHSAGFKHDYLPTAKKVITELGEKSGMFTVFATEDCKILTSKNLKQYDTVLFATTGELPISAKQKEDLIETIKNGTGFFGLHNATDTFYEFPEYGKMLGGYFNGHPWSQEVTVKVEDRTHPATLHLPESLKALEEVYTFKEWSREKTHILISLDNSSVDLSKGNRKDNDYGISWCHTYGKARVFYTGFGHYIELWSKEWFQKHLLNGILWTMKLK
jgi:type 1 glutamine amidotransferase